MNSPLRIRDASMDDDADAMDLGEHEGWSLPRSCRPYRLVRVYMLPVWVPLGQFIFPFVVMMFAVSSRRRLWDCVVCLLSVHAWTCYVCFVILG
jgi:hypothetical protein